MDKRTVARKVEDLEQAFNRVVDGKPALTPSEEADFYEMAQQAIQQNLSDFEQKKGIYKCLRNKQESVEK